MQPIRKGVAALAILAAVAVAAPLAASAATASWGTVTANWFSGDRRTVNVTIDDHDVNPFPGTPSSIIEPCTYVFVVRTDGTKYNFGNTIRDCGGAPFTVSASVPSSGAAIDKVCAWGDDNRGRYRWMTVSDFPGGPSQGCG